MTLVFYPHTEDTQKGSLEDRIEVLMEGAERFKAFILDASSKIEAGEEVKNRLVPRDIAAAFNWDEIARVLREVRELKEASKSDKSIKSQFLTKLSEIYEVLRAAKMPKLEAVRLALIGEAAQLRNGSSRVA